MTREEAIRRIKAWNLNLDHKEVLAVVIPELAESEDERVRNSLLEFLDDVWHMGKDANFDRWGKADCADWIAYLEKRKEENHDGKKWLTPEQLHRIEQLRYEAGFDAGVRSEMKKRKEQEPISFSEPYNPDDYEVVMEGNATGLKKKERKPAEWNELQSEFKNINEAFEDGKKEVVAHPEKYGLCDCEPKPEWGEKDEKRLKETLALVETIEDINKAKDGFLDVKIWLESLPERFVLQPKLEWGEEEMKVLDSIIDDYEKAAKSFCGYDGKIMLLKAIRDGEHNLSKQEWSEEDETHRAFILESLEDQIRFCKKDAEGAYRAKQIRTAQNWLKSLRPQPKNELSEEDKEELIINRLVSLGYPIDANGNVPNYNQTFESCKSALVHWLRQNLQKMLANKRIEPDGIKTETLLKDSYIQAYREGVEDSIRELSLL